jgi:hypothetical protein
MYELSVSLRSTTSCANLALAAIRVLPVALIRSTERHQECLFELVRQDKPKPENDSYGERDFGCIELDKTKYFWKIDYRNWEGNGLSLDPSDPEMTFRLLTIMRADEY